jgi:C4-dicarboxylate transporter DctQ subunit
MKRAIYFIERLIRHSSNASAIAAGMAIYFMAGAVFINVLLRWLFDYSMNFVPEYSGYLVVSIAYFGLAYTALVGGHISVDVVTRKLPKRMANGLRVISDFVALCFVIMLLFYNLRFFAFSWRIGNTSAETQLPMWITQICLWAGLIIFTLSIVRLLVAHFLIFLQKNQSETGNGLFQY